MGETTAERELRAMAAAHRDTCGGCEIIDACDIGREAIALLGEREVIDAADYSDVGRAVHRSDVAQWQARVRALLTRAWRAAHGEDNGR